MKHELESMRYEDRLVADRIELMYRMHLNFSVINLMTAGFIFGIYDGFLESKTLNAWIGCLVVVVVLEMSLYVGYLYSREQFRAVVWERAYFFISLLGCVAVGGGVWWVQGADMMHARWPITVVIMVYAVILYGMHLLNVPMLAICMSILLLPAIAYYVFEGMAQGYLFVMALLIVGVMLVACAVPSSQFFKSSSLSRYRIEELSKRLEIETTNKDVALELAHQADVSKTAFFAAANHDLRQPLHAIGLLVESLKLDLSSSRRPNDVLRQLEGNVHILNQMFNHYLDVSRIETGQLKVEMQVFEVQDVFNDMMVQYRLQAAEKGLQLRMSLTEAKVYSDRSIVAQMVGNLISNAIAYTDAGYVWMGYRQSQQVIEVRDSGVGIAVEQQEAIFKDFYQVQHDSTTRPHSYGIGLSVVRRLAQVLQTPLSVRSKPGCGSVFRIQLKLVREACPGKAYEGDSEMDNKDAIERP